MSVDTADGWQHYTDLARNLDPDEAEAIPTSRLPRALQRVNAATYRIEDYATNGSGTEVDPWLGWESSLNTLVNGQGITLQCSPGQHYGFLNPIVIPEYNNVNDQARGNQGLRWQGNGAHLHYLGSATIQTAMKFGIPTSIFGFLGLSLTDFVFHAHGKVRDFVTAYYAHNSTWLNLRFIPDGLGTAMILSSCVGPLVNGYYVSHFDWPGIAGLAQNANNTYQHGLAFYDINNGITNNSEGPACNPTLTHFEISGTQSHGILIDNSFDFYICSGASESTVTGHGIYVTGTSTQAMSIIHVDNESSGSGYGIYIEQCENLLIQNCQMFNASLYLGAATTNVIVLGGGFYSCVHNGDGLYVLGAHSGFDQTQSQLTGTGIRRSVPLSASAPFRGFQDDSIVFGQVQGTALQGARFDTNAVGGLLLYNIKIPSQNQVSYSILYQSDSGDSRLNGRSVDIGVGFVSSLKVNANGSLNFPTAITAATVSGLSKVVPIADGNGTIIGYIPVYSTKT